MKTITWKHKVSFLLVMILSLAFVYPMLWMILSSLKNPEQILDVDSGIFLTNIHWDNFAKALSAAPFVLYLWNSTWSSILIVISQLFLSSLLAYGLTQFRFLGRNTLFGIILGTYMLPSAATYIPSYILLGKIGMTNSLWGLVFSNLANIFMIFLLRQNFQSVPKEMVEAARSEGVNEWQILWKIIVPMNKGAMINASLISFVGNFNSYLWPSILLNDQEQFTISLGLNSFSATQGTFNEIFPILMAGTTLSVIPLIILYIVLQRYFTDTSQTSTIKG